MDIATIIGLVIAWGAILGGFVMEGGSIGSLVSPSAAIIVIGGSFGATVVSFALKHTTSLPIIFKQALLTKRADPLELLQTVVAAAKKARQSGILALESDAKDQENTFIRNALQLVVDGTPPELVREILETEIQTMRERHQTGSQFFASWGGFLPTLGVLGTVMGLVHMLENLDDPGSMGEGIATAFIATLYGVGIANLFCLPIATKLRNSSHQEIAAYEMAIEGILSLQAGDNPRLVLTKMRAFLPPSAKRELDALEA